MARRRHKRRRRTSFWRGASARLAGLGLAPLAHRKESVAVARYAATDVRRAKREISGGKCQRAFYSIVSAATLLGVSRGHAQGATAGAMKKYRKVQAIKNRAGKQVSDAQVMFVQRCLPGGMKWE